MVFLHFEAPFNAATFPGNLSSGNGCTTYFNDIFLKIDIVKFHCMEKVG